MISTPHSQINKKLKISIVTPNYNYSKYVEKCILSVVQQDYDNLEHIIVDDGSTDNSVEIIKKLQNQYPNKIKLILQENRGQTPAINRGLREATGDIIGWINSDDYYESGVIKKIAQAFEIDPELMVVYGDLKIIDEQDNSTKVRKALNFNYFLFLMKGFGINMASNTVFWRRELLNEVGFLKDKFYINMDGEFFARLTFNKKVKKLDFIIANWRKHPMTKTAAVKNKKKLYEYKFEKEYELRTNYSKLKISRIIPYKFIFLIKYPSIVLRMILRLFTNIFR